LTNGQVNRPMALYWPVAWSYWWNKPLASGLEQNHPSLYSIGQ
jgi:hypothetical protein